MNHSSFTRPKPLLLAILSSYLSRNSRKWSNNFQSTVVSFFRILIPCLTFIQACDPESTCSHKANIYKQAYSATFNHRPYRIDAHMNPLAFSFRPKLAGQRLNPSLSIRGVIGFHPTYRLLHCLTDSESFKNMIWMTLICYSMHSIGLLVLLYAISRFQFRARKPALLATLHTRIQSMLPS